MTKTHKKHPKPEKHTNAHFLDYIRQNVGEAGSMPIDLAKMASDLDAAVEDVQWALNFLSGWGMLLVADGRVGFADPQLARARFDNAFNGGRHQ